MKRIIAAGLVALSLAITAPAQAGVPLVTSRAEYTQRVLYRSCVLRFYLTGNYSLSRAERICTRLVYGA